MTRQAGNAYFESYGDLRVHKTMLNDEPRMRAYHEAIVKAKDYFEDAVVLDLGCGTGILAMWVARETSARRIIAVDACAEMAKIARQLVRENDLKVEVIHSKIEEFECGEPVDIIISEWMGHFLLHEGMLDSLLHARDHFLRRAQSSEYEISQASELPPLDHFVARKTRGLLFPSEAQIFGEISHVCAMDQISDLKSDLLFGIDVSAIFGSHEILDDGQPRICHIHQRPSWAKAEHVLAKYDLNTLTIIEDIRCRLTSSFRGDGIANCYAVSFTCTFPGGTTLDTRSGRPPTHWKQTLVPFGGNFPVNADMSITYEVGICRTSDLRQFEISFEVV